MGGSGSGKRGWLPTIEDGLKLDLRSLRRRGIFKANAAITRTTLTWSHSYTGEQVASVGLTLSAGGGESWMRLTYSFSETYGAEKSNVEQLIYLTKVAQPFGGYRWYFLCPSTGKHCLCLYKPYGATYFRSRGGFRVRLQYRSQHCAPHDRVTEKGNCLAAKVLRAGDSKRREQYQDWAFPPKPPWMHWKTYNRHFAQWERCEAQDNAYLIQLIQRLGKL